MLLPVNHPLLVTIAKKEYIFLPVWQSLVLSSNVYSGSEKQTLTWKNEVFPCLHTREMSHYCFSRQGETSFCFSLPGETTVAHFSGV